MDMERSDDGGIRRLRLSGNFDTTDVEGFLAYIEEAIDDRCYLVLIDAANMRFINSTALGSLIKAQKRLQQFDGDLSVCTLPAFVSSVFKTLGLDRKIRCFREEGEAEEYLRSLSGKCVDVPGEDDLGFLFTDPSQVAIAGDDPRSALVKSLSEERIVFHWPDEEGLDRAEVLRSGTPLHTRFTLRLYHPEHVFEAHVAVEGVSDAEGGGALVSARFVTMSDEDRRAVEKFLEDLRGLGGDIGALS